MESHRSSCEIKRKSHVFFLIILVLLVGTYYIDFLKDIHVNVIAFVTPFAILFSYCLCPGREFVNKKNVLYVVLIVGILVFSFFVSSSGYGSLFNNLSCILYIVLFYELSLNKSEISVVVKLFTGLQMYLILYTLIKGYMNGYVGSYNANTIALQVLLNMVLINIWTNRKRSRTFFLNILSLGIIIYCKSRTSLLVGSLFFVWMFLERRKTVRKQMLKICFWIIVVIGVAFPAGYVLLYQNYDSPLVSSLIGFSLKYFNKNLFTGREMIWEPALEALSDSGLNMLFGIGTHFNGGKLFGSNFHNSYFTIVICCGVVGYLLITVFLYRLYVKCLESKTILSKRCCMAYLTIMIVGFFESVLFSGQISLLLYLILAIGHAHFDTSVEDRCKGELEQ